MNYSRLSDFGINCLVGKRLGKIVATHKGDAGSAVGLVETGEFTYTYYDFCNNPADAWPIIIEHHIAVVPYRHTLPQAWPIAFGVISKFTTEDKNPLRAAMIVFLMMQESANVQDNSA